MRKNRRLSVMLNSKVDFGVAKLIPFQDHWSGAVAALRMLRLPCIILLLLMGASDARAALVTVCDTLKLANNALYQGTLSISWPTFTDSGGVVHPRGAIQTQVRAGVLNVSLQANDTATPTGTYYQVTYSLSLGLPNPEVWVVPTSGSCVNLATVRTVTPPTLTYNVSLAQISAVSGGVLFGENSHVAQDTSNFTYDRSTLRLSFTNGSIQSASSAFILNANTGNDLNLGNSNVFAAVIRVPRNTGDLLFPNLGGLGTRCLHIDNNGKVTQATADCGTGGGGATIAATTSAIKGDGTGNGVAVTGTGTNCVLVNGSSASCGGGATIAATSNVIKGDGAGNGVAVTGTGTDCVHVNGSSAACGGGGGSTNPSSLTCSTSISTTVLTAETSAGSTTPCAYGINDTTYVFTASPTVTITVAPTTPGIFVLYINTSGQEEMQITSGIGGTFVGASVSVVSVSAPSFPAGSYPKATGTVSVSTSWTTVVDVRPSAGAKAYLSAGSGIGTITNGVVAIDSTVPQKGATNVFTGSNDFSTGTRLSIPAGTTLPATCSVGDLFFKSNATAGQNVYECQSANTWTQETGGGGGSTTTETYDLPAGGCDSVPTGRAQWWTSGTNPAAIGCDTTVGEAAYPSSGANQARAHMIVPLGWTAGAVNLVLYGRDTAASLAKTFTIQTQCYTDGGASAPGTPGSYNATQTLTFTPTAAGYFQKQLSSLTMTGCSAGNLLDILIIRTDSNAGTDYVNGVYLTFVRAL